MSVNSFLFVTELDHAKTVQSCIFSSLVNLSHYVYTVLALTCVFIIMVIISSMLKCHLKTFLLMPTLVIKLLES